MEDARLRCFLSSSKRSLFDDTNAISMPEKKAENASVQSIKGMFSKIVYEIIIS